LKPKIFWKSQFLSHEDSPCWFIYEAGSGRMCMVEAEGWDDTDFGGCILTTCSLRYYGTSTFVQIYSYVHVCFTVHSTYQILWDLYFIQIYSYVHVCFTVHHLPDTIGPRTYPFVQIYSYVHVRVSVHSTYQILKELHLCKNLLLCTCLLDSLRPYHIL